MSSSVWPSPSLLPLLGSPLMRAPSRPELPVLDGFTTLLLVVFKVADYQPYADDGAGNADVMRLWRELWKRLIAGELEAFAIVPGHALQPISAGDWAACATHGPPGRILWRSTAESIPVTPLLRDKDVSAVARIWGALRQGASPDTGADTAAEASPASPTKGLQARRGRRTAYDWPAFIACAKSKLEDEGALAPAAGSSFTQADLERHLLEWCGKNWERTPSESTARVHVRAAISAWQAGK